MFEARSQADVVGGGGGEDEMAITKDRKTEIIDGYRRKPDDTGSPEPVRPGA